MTRREVVVTADHVQLGAHFAVALHRTLRLPADGRAHPLPPGLGVLPIHPAPEALAEPGADATVVVPLHPQEATWIGFRAHAWHPTAVTVALGGVNAISGTTSDGRWPELAADPQSYVVCPPQVWLDGVNAGPGRIRQLVAVPVGSGQSVEAAVTGREEMGGLTVAAFPPVAGRFPDEAPPEPPGAAAARPMASPLTGRGGGPGRMGFGAGGAMRQRIYPDPHGLSTWDRTSPLRLGVVVVEATSYEGLTGRRPPPSPIDAQTYADHGLPWFELDDAHLGDVDAPPPLTDLPAPDGPTGALHGDDDHVVVIAGPTTAPATRTGRLHDDEEEEDG